MQLLVGIRYISEHNILLTEIFRPGEDNFEGKNITFNNLFWNMSTRQYP